VDVDFASVNMPGYQTISGTSGDPWGGLWDVTWGGSLTTQRPWMSLEGEGHCFAPRLEGVSADSRFRWAASLFTLEQGQGVGLG
jgi:hypothetical protein